MSADSQPSSLPSLRNGEKIEREIERYRETEKDRRDQKRREEKPEADKGQNTGSHASTRVRTIGRALQGDAMP